MTNSQLCTASFGFPASSFLFRCMEGIVGSVISRGSSPAVSCALSHERTRTLGLFSRRLILLAVLTHSLFGTRVVNFGKGFGDGAYYELFLVGLAIVVSLLTGIVSGVVPAYRAARMNPVDALRSE